MLEVVIGPVGEGRGLAHQFGLAPARHLAKRGIDIGDAALQVQGAHAGEHGVFHGAAKIGFRHQRLLRLHAPAGVAPVGDQHPGGHGTQHHDQPEQAAANHAQRRPVGLTAQRQAIADGRNRHLVCVDGAGPGQQMALGLPSVMVLPASNLPCASCSETAYLALISFGMP